MFPAAFDYRAPVSLDEALGLLAEQGDAAKVMAGGQSLIPLLRLRFAQPALVVDIGRLPSMADITRDDGHIRIGALVRHVDIERSTELAKHLPLMVEAVHWIADPLVRNRGTVVGAGCPAGPSGGWGAIRLGLDHAGAQRGRGCPVEKGRARNPRRRLLRGPVHDHLAARRGRDRDPDPTALGSRRWVVSQARAQGW